MLANKHASSTSSIQQSADIGRQFANFKTECKTTTAENLPHGFGLKGFLEDMFDILKANGTLVVKLPAKKAIIDHCVCCPEILSKSMAPKTTIKGFIVNGMVDAKLNIYPDVRMFLKTCKSEVTKEHEDLLLATFQSYILS